MVGGAAARGGIAVSMTDQELTEFVRQVMAAISHRSDCSFTRCNCEAATAGPIVYARASAILRASRKEGPK